MPAVHKETLIADKKATEMVGTGVLLESLTKLESMGEAGRSKRLRFARFRRPSIRERIDNLREY